MSSIDYQFQIYYTIHTSLILQLAAWDCSAEYSGPWLHAGGESIPGMIQMRWAVDGVVVRIQPSRFPCFSASGRREAGSYRLPAVKQGKLNFCPT